MQISGSKVVESVLNLASPYVQKLKIITNTPKEYSWIDIETEKISGRDVAHYLGYTRYCALALQNMCWWFLVIYRLWVQQIEQLVSSCRGHDITIFKHKNFESLCAVYR